jgi:hypothetical protein
MPTKDELTIPQKIAHKTWRIREHYNADHDLDPGMAPVPWSVVDLMNAVNILATQMEKMREELDALKGGEQ